MLRSYLKSIREICQSGGFDPEHPTGLPVHLPYKSMLTVLKACNDVSSSRTSNWQAFCLEEKSTLLYLFQSSFVLDDGLAPLLLQVIHTALSGVPPKAQTPKETKEPSKKESEGGGRGKGKGKAEKKEGKKEGKEKEGKKQRRMKRRRKRRKNRQPQIRRPAGLWCSCSSPSRTTPSSSSSSASSCCSPTPPLCAGRPTPCSTASTSSCIPRSRFTWSSSSGSCGLTCPGTATKPPSLWISWATSPS